MPDLFSQSNQNKSSASTLSLKKSQFRKQIRSKDISQKIQIFRMLGTDRPHIKSLVNALPASWLDLADFMIHHEPYHQAITKDIIHKIYPLEFCQTNSAENTNTYFLLPQNQPSNLYQFKKEIYLFSILLKHQGMYAPNILKRYYPFILERGQHFNALSLIFCLLNQVIKQPNLNWIPTNEIIKTIESIEKSKSQTQKLIYQQEVQMYVYLTQNYFEKTKQTPQIRNKIRCVLEMGSESFQFIRPKTFFKLCLNITYFQDPSKQNNISSATQKQEDKISIFHEALIKGRIVKNLYRIIFYSKKEKLRLISLQILKNLMIQYGSSFVWNDQKLCPVQRFEEEIKDESNSSGVFLAFSEIFLVSILQLPKHQLHKIQQGEVKVLQLMQYILQNVDNNSGQGNQIDQRARQCIWYMFEEGNNQMKSYVANSLLQSRWKNKLGPQSDLVLECQNFINSPS